MLSKSAKSPKLNKSASSKSGRSVSQVRLIGGVHKRRQIPFVAADGLRPTPDRVRETLFNWLTPHLHGAHVLDAFAGSGVLGFEALSRGAHSLLLIEQNRAQATILAQTIANLSLNAALKIGDALTILPALTTQQFDLAFIDPPYAAALWQTALALVLPLVKINGFIYIEANQSLDNIINGDNPHNAPFAIIKQQKMGQIFVYLLQKAA